MEATTAGSRSRRRASQAAATVARALDRPEELVSQLRELGKGYSAARSQSTRELPREQEIEALLDRLSHRWQWPVAVAATYGCRPHEALLFAEVQPSRLLRIADGKTGSRQSLALPAEWIERWSLERLNIKVQPDVIAEIDCAALRLRATRSAVARALICSGLDQLRCAAEQSGQ